MIATLTLAVVLAIAPMSADRAVSAAAGEHCSRHIQTTGCGHGGTIVVTGTGGSGGSGGESSDGGGTSGAPVTRKWIGCASPAAVRALGDRSTAVNSGAICGQAAVRACRAEDAAVGVPHSVQVLLILQPDGTWAFGGSTCAAAGPPKVTAEMVRDRIARLVPGARVGIAPAGQTLVNIETVMWVDAPKSQPLAPLTILGRRVTVQLTLDHVDWSFGDGASTATSEPGTAYNEKTRPCHTAMCDGYWGHVYRDTGDVTVSATAAWRAQFSVDGGVAVPIPGTVAGPAGNADLVVREARGILVPDPNTR